MTLQTANWGMPKPELGESPNGPAQIGALADFLDNNANGRVAMVSQGILNDRPVSTPAAPGKRDRRYLVVGDANAANNGREFVDTGTSWVEIFGQVPAAIAGNGLKSTAGVLDVDLAADPGLEFTAGLLRALVDGATLERVAGGLRVKDGGITAAKIAAALKPSAGAGAGTEALRAIGAAASQVVAGNDARLTDQRVPTDLSVTDAKVAAANKDGAAGTPSLRTLGLGAAQAMPGNQVIPVDQLPDVPMTQATGAAFAIPNNANTMIPLTAQQFTRGGLVADLPGDQIIIVRPGIYRITMHTGWAAAVPADDSRTVANILRVNGVATEFDERTAHVQDLITSFTPRVLAAGDAIQAMVWHDTGAARNATPQITVEFISD